MSDKLNDLIKKISGQDGKVTSTPKNILPKFGSKPIHEHAVPDFGMKSEHFTENKQKKSNDNN